jgi:hypothetical protein
LQQCQALTEENERLQASLRSQPAQVQVIDNVYLQSQVDTLQWQLKQVCDHPPRQQVAPPFLSIPLLLLLLLFGSGVFRPNIRRGWPNDIIFHPPFDLSLPSTSFFPPDIVQIIKSGSILSLTLINHNYNKI